LLAQTRAFFGERGFVEIEAQVLVPAPGLEVHIEAVEAGGAYLSTSPEFQLKRLLVAKLERIYSLGKCFRANESGRHHAVEFTMLEWYRAEPDLGTIAGDVEALVGTLAGDAVERGGRSIDLTTPWPRLTVADLFAEHAGVELLGDEPAAELGDKIRAAGIDAGTATAWDDLFYCAWVERIDPLLETLESPIFVVDWPVRLAALARSKPGSPSWVERFEVYVGGLELANAFGELTDPVEQRRRFEADQAERARRGRPVYPIDERFMAALESGMPESAGIALGFDRLVMLCLGAETIAEVQAS
jgi:lysyl-tRNA synthetase class 2